MLYIKKIIQLLRSALYDLSINISTRCSRDLSSEALDYFALITSSLDKLEFDFSEFLDLYKENKK